MNKTLKIFIFVLLLILGANLSYSQTITIKVDSIQNGKTKNKTESSNTPEYRNQNRFGQKAAGSGTVKKVKGARPDMSKAKGARPPDIVRPSGSGIPRGMGKPGGARHRGGM